MNEWQSKNYITNASRALELEWLINIPRNVDALGKKTVAGPVHIHLHTSLLPADTTLRWGMCVRERNVHDVDRKKKQSLSKVPMYVQCVSHTEAAARSPFMCAAASPPIASWGIRHNEKRAPSISAQTHSVRSNDRPPETQNSLFDIPEIKRARLVWSAAGLVLNSDYRRRKVSGLFWYLNGNVRKLWRLRFCFVCGWKIIVARVAA